MSAPRALTAGHRRTIWRRTGAVILAATLVLALAAPGSSAGNELASGATSAEPSPHDFPPAPPDPTPPSPPEPTPPEPSPPTPPEPAPPSPPDTPTDDGGIEAWVWALVAVAAASLILAVFLVGRGSKSNPPLAAEVPTSQERQELLIHTLSGWTANGWVIESQTGEMAILRRGDERRQVTVDEAGRIYQTEIPGNEHSTGSKPPESQ